VEFHDARIEVGEGLDGQGFGVTIVFPVSVESADLK